MEEKLFRILLGGLMAIVCPEDGRWTRILPSGWRDGQPKTALIFMSKSRMSRHRVSRSLPQTIGQQRRSVAYADARSQIPSEFRERKTKYGSKGSFSI